MTGIQEKTDIVYAIDSSRRVDDGMHSKMKNMVKAGLKSYTISPSETRAAIVGFGSQANTAVNLYEGANLTELEASVENLKQIGGPRRMNKALQLVRSDIFTNPLNSRSNSKKVVVLLTTGKNIGNSTGELPSAALGLRSEGVEVIVIAIGKEKHPKEVEIITGKSENTIFVDGMDGLPISLGILEARVREAGGIFLLYLRSTS